MNTPTLDLARSLQKATKRLTSIGYSHPPIIESDKAWFKAYRNGVAMKVTVELLD